MVPSGMLRGVALVRTDVSEELSDYHLVVREYNSMLNSYSYGPNMDTTNILANEMEEHNATQWRMLKFHNQVL
jgi:hypothetical protein